MLTTPNPAWKNPNYKERLRSTGWSQELLLRDCHGHHPPAHGGIPSALRSSGCQGWPGPGNTSGPEPLCLFPPFVLPVAAALHLPRGKPKRWCLQGTRAQLPLEAERGREGFVR